VRFTPPGRFRTLAEMRARAAEVAPALIADEVLLGAAGPFGQPITVLGRKLANRFACQPMEGWDGTADGLPTDLTLRRWRRFGESGAALVWGGEAFAVQRDGRANARQLYREPAADSLGGLSKLRAELLAGAAARGDASGSQLIGLQLTHSGRFARPDGPPAPRPAFQHPVLDRKYPLLAGAPLLTDGELEGIGESFVAAAKMAQQAGFDFVDVKACHGYLLHELLGARARPGAYGGDLAGRTRLLRRILAAIRSACPGLGLGVRLSLADTAPYEAGPDGIGRPMDCEIPYLHGFGVNPLRPADCDFRDALELIPLLSAEGVKLLNVTLGSPYWNPHLQRPAAYPPSDGYQPPDDPLVFVARQIEAARLAKATVPGLCVVSTGWTYLQEFLPHFAQPALADGAADFIGLGRMLLSYPDLPRDLLAGRAPDRRRLCRTFSDCTTAPRNGMVSGCYPLDDYYRALPEAARVKALRPEAGA
jgi:2,4-dienoyl-CoA reductase-like NADH-dependent reductase (Old Yellow Enzyme family)